MKTILVDVYDRSVKPVDVEDKLSEFYRLLRCGTIDITQREIGGKVFDVMCDDEGLLTDNPIVSAFDSDGRMALVGNLMFFHTDGEGNLVGLTDNESAHLLACAEWHINLEDGSITPVMTRCDFAY